jgi:hypothetical protein
LASDTWATAEDLQSSSSELPPAADISRPRLDAQIIIAGAAPGF